MGPGKAMAPAQTRAWAAPRLCTKPIFFIHSINIGGDIALGAVVAAEIFCFVPSLKPQFFRQRKRGGDQGEAAGPV